MCIPGQQAPQAWGPHRCSGISALPKCISAKFGPDYLICPRALIAPSFSSRDWELAAVLPPTSSSSSGLAPSLVWRQQVGPPSLCTALTSEPPQGLHQPRDPAHSPHLHRYHLRRLQLHVLDSGGAVQMSPLRGAHLNPAPPFPGERPKLLPAQSVPDILWERHTASARLLVSGLPYTRVPPNLLDGHGHTHTLMWWETTLELSRVRHEVTGEKLWVRPALHTPLQPLHMPGGHNGSGCQPTYPQSSRHPSRG